MDTSPQPKLGRLATYKDSLVWKRLHKLGDPGLEAAVDNVATAATHILSTVVAHMPLYTLHNGVHIRNVIAWMDWLLGPTVDGLCSIECALLLMAAYTHDLGMALTTAEHEVLCGDGEGGNPSARRREYDAFLEDYRDAQQQLKNLEAAGRPYAARMIRNHLLTEYLRKTHSDQAAYRMKGHLDAIAKGNQTLFQHYGTDYRRLLEFLSISHNQDHGWLGHQIQAAHCQFGTSTVRLTLLGAALRLADIMDFDASRTPTILYRHLGLDGKAFDVADADFDGARLSGQEWKKHLAISGIEFDSKTLTYYAVACPDPVTHKSILSFIGWIRQEVESAAQFAGALRLPLVKANIVPALDSYGKQLYEYHDWEFHLSHAEIVELLMGESLYGDPGLAIRELIQNALDALELRDLRLQYEKVPTGA